jgi:uncharacterized membrane protein
MTRTVVALYDHLTQAHDAVADLIESGVDRTDISLMAYDAEGAYARQMELGERAEVETLSGTGVGAVIGTLGGLLVGLGAMTVPGLGPVITAGTLGATLLSAGVGAAVGGLIGALVDAGIPEPEAEYYAEGIRRGGTLVVAQVPDAAVDEVAAVLNRHYPVDIDARVARWEEEGWEGYDVETPPYTRTDVEREREYWEEEEVISESPYSRTY